MNGTYKSMSHTLSAVYKQHCWKLYGNLNVTTLLLGEKDGFTKYCCLLLMGQLGNRIPLYCYRLGSKIRVHYWDSNVKYTPYPQPVLLTCIAYKVVANYTFYEGYGQKY
jgi:hypothetical protein